LQSIALLDQVFHLPQLLLQAGKAGYSLKLVALPGLSGRKACRIEHVLAVHLSRRFT